MTVSFLLPVAEPQTTRPYHLTVRKSEGLRIGLLANGFPDTENFLARLSDALAALLPDATFRIDTKGARHTLSACIQDPLLTELVHDCDAMVIAWGHCGSCTSGVSRDAIAFADRGVPSVTLICDTFWSYAEWMAAALGMPNTPRVEVPFPTAGTGEANQRKVAGAIAPKILSLLGIEHQRAVA